MFSLDYLNCAKRPLCKLEVGPVVDVICNWAVILCCNICLLWSVTVCGWRLMIPLSSQIWGNPLQECAVLQQWELLRAPTVGIAALPGWSCAAAAVCWFASLITVLAWWQEASHFGSYVLRVFWNVKFVRPSPQRNMVSWGGGEDIWAKPGQLFLRFSCFLFPLYSVYRQFSGLSHIPSLSVVLVFFPSQHICTLFMSSLCNASSTTHAGIYPSCFCLTWPGAVLGSELVVTCSVVSICSPVCR